VAAEQTGLFIATQRPSMVAKWAAIAAILAEKFLLRAHPIGDCLVDAVGFGILFRA
jgi:hypothetical protein